MQGPNHNEERRLQEQEAYAVEDQAIADLFKQLQKTGNPNFFSQLVDKLMHYVFNLAWQGTYNQQDAEDVVQQVFVILARKYKVIRNPQKLKSWLWKTTFRLARKKQRNIWDSSVPFDEAIKKHASPDIAPDKAAEQSEETNIVQNELNLAVNKLSLQQRKCIILHYIKRLPVHEVAVRLGLSNKTVYESCSKGLNKLAKNSRLRKCYEGLS